MALAFSAGAIDAAAGMGSGPIQALPWAAKQRPKADNQGQKGVESDTQPTESPRADPIAGPTDFKPKN